MTDIRRFSSRRQKLDSEFLTQRLKGAKSYRRIAGYFRSSIFELVGEEIADIPNVRIVCNSELDLVDIAVSKAAREASLKEMWNVVPVEAESLLYRDRYRKLFELLTRGNVQIRVVPKQMVFLHGKAGVVEGADGSKTCFMGSINESRSAFAANYEILWEDPSPEGVQWVEEEFDALWKEGHPLPDAIVEEISRVANRVEVRFEGLPPSQVPAASLVEAPLYRGGEQLQPWQRSFVTMFLQHREVYGKVRLLLADEVGLGKTLSLATSAMVSALLDDGKVLILCPSTLTLQWQVELKDRLGIPSAVWLSNKKVWQDQNGHIIKTRGAADVTRCPTAIAIVSTGLIFHMSTEREELLKVRYGTVILDEGHKARTSRTLGSDDGEANNLLEFMLQIGPRTRHLLIGTATPIQTNVDELWDLLKILNAGADFVLGRAYASQWHVSEKVLPYVKGEKSPTDGKEAWDLLRAPLPPHSEADSRIFQLRMAAGIPDETFFSQEPYSDLPFMATMAIDQMVNADFFKENNPILRHTVLRRRAVLEERGLLERVAVDVHPDPKAEAGTYLGLNLNGLGLMASLPFELAYKAAEGFTAALSKRTKAAGFMKSLLLQRICSSFAAGRSTAQMMLDKRPIEDDEAAEQIADALSVLTPEEAGHLQTIVQELTRPEARDPKLAAVKYFLCEHRTEGRTWLEHGCIVFSQYYDTALWVASELAKLLPNETVAVYAGVGKSGLFRGELFSTVEREHIKTAVKRRELRLVVATDAACEGLNLQTLGALINVDLPWNPSRLEQRLGRIKRIGQVRKSVDMLNLVYHGTRDENVYQALSKRLKDKFDIFGGLPDTIDDDWIEDQSRLEEELDKYLHLRDKARNVFELRYQSDESLAPDENRWELCSQVLSRKDIVEKLSAGWG
ncbi:phospholipase D-like domain-containing anti-phage protein [Variovorax sp. J31P207]|uniref:phospholipase D-like domain-containing anti-phage protein n=1 Tax=Variovorax sp. J31P207 TaxID=3053510 RepID=UPI00257835B2|nr:phospholipase D-like domain-containing anti-phage protein [Variovorax sp. J31P207]MDM0068787.1 phospholipase D-like domain-containing protein [Variovorax sp. J31P207]